MNSLSEGKMEQVIVGVVATMVIVGATFLGYNSKIDAANVYTAVITGLFGYSGMANRNNKEKE